MFLFEEKSDDLYKFLREKEAQSGGYGVCMFQT